MYGTQCKMLARHTAGKCIKILLGNRASHRIHRCTGLLDQSKTFLHSSRATFLHQDRNERAMPSVYVCPNPFQWLNIKWQILKLKNLDKGFNEEEFNRGSKQAISVVTSIVKDEKLEDLEDLLTPFALAKLRLDMLVLWDDEIVRNIDLKLSDIKLAVPTKVHIQTTQLPYKKLCDIDMVYMAMKWMDKDALLVIRFVARFSRDFTYDQYNSDWTISLFELRTYHVYSYK